MSPSRRRVVTVLLCGLAGASGRAPAAPSEAEARKIEALIRFVESRQDIRFVRNGSRYTAAQGARVGRAGVVSVDLRDDGLWVGGTSHTLIRGTVDL